MLKVFLELGFVTVGGFPVAAVKGYTLITGILGQGKNGGESTDGGVRSAFQFLCSEQTVCLLPS